MKPKTKKWVIYIVIAILLIWLIFFIDWGGEEQGFEEVNTSAITGEVVQETKETETTQECEPCECDECEACEECESCECEECPSCPSCPSCPECPEAKTVIEGAEELASDSLVSIDSYNERIINVDSENFTYWLVNTKDYALNNVHAKLVITIDEDNEKTVLSEVYSLSGKENKSFEIPVGLTARDEKYKAKLTVYSANNKGLTKDVEFKVNNLNPDVENSKAFWKNSIIGFSEYRITGSNVNVTLINNRNANVTLLYLSIGDKTWLVDKTIEPGAELEFTKDKGLCSSGIYSLPVYMNYTSAGFEYEIKEDQELVGYCR